MTHRDLAALLAAVAWVGVAFAVAHQLSGNYTWGAVVGAVGLLAIGRIWWSGPPGGE